MKQSKTIVLDNSYQIDDRLASYENYLYSVYPIKIETAIEIEKAHKKHRIIMKMLTGSFFMGLGLCVYLSISIAALFMCLSQVVLLIYLHSRHLQKYTYRLIPHGIDEISECCTDEVSDSTYHRLTLIKHPQLKQKVNEILSLRQNRFLCVDAETLQLDRYFSLSEPLK